MGTSSADVNGDGVADKPLQRHRLISMVTNRVPCTFSMVDSAGFDADRRQMILLRGTNANQAGFDLSFIDANGDVHRLW